MLRKDNPRGGGFINGGCSSHEKQPLTKDDIILTAFVYPNGRNMKQYSYKCPLDGVIYFQQNVPESIIDLFINNHVKLTTVSLPDESFPDLAPLGPTDVRVFTAELSELPETTDFNG
jgi:hypothetical protein